MPRTTQLNGPATITHFKNIRGPVAGPALVYMGGGGEAPAYVNGAFLTGAHPGRWVSPSQMGTVGTHGEAGAFLAVSGKRRSHSVAPGAVCVLVQHTRCTHIVVVASDEYSVAGAPADGYRYYRWVYVLAMGAYKVALEGGRPAWFSPGSNYHPYANSNYHAKDSFRLSTWREFCSTGNNLLQGRSVLVPDPPSVTLSYPNSYP